MKKYVEIVKRDNGDGSGEVNTLMGPFDEEKAKKVEDWAKQVLNHRLYWVRIVDEPTQG